MLRRLSIVFCLLLAFITFQAHNFIPHHHAKEHPEAQHHHDDDEHDNDHHDTDTDQDSPFNDLTHNPEFGKTLVKPQIFKDIIEKPVLLACTRFIFLSNKLASLEDLTRYHPPDDDSRLHVIFLSHSIPFRAPPAFPS